ncbi:1,2-dihydroxy-3-keto-5-methylthiopentene dioxygenase [Alkalimonas mucilaginosa]|uniref:Acireductone dioxygenase n=1 Tax=Alkalimonas mucilaginosa TaxID=3057676 RepID=A0ABU7JIM2_9GAMM|nr:acireductone dioxygenase [Alkalimonas sp. MEB004]MEE2025522.1 acireductone dioxygenase [Alkalimonas sp. MEB004]
MSSLTIYTAQEPTQPVFQSDNLVEIAEKLQQQGIRFEQWQANQPIEASTDHASILAAYSDDIARLKQQGGYVTVDVISLSSDHPDKVALRQKFLAEHTHSEDEVRFFVRGEGLFCLHLGEHIYQVLCQQNDLISVPANTPHWFDMGSDPNFTAIRLFNNPEGWVANFTGSEIASRFPLLP